MRLTFILALCGLAITSHAATSMLTRTGNFLVYSEQFQNSAWTSGAINAFGATDTGAAGAGSFANTSRTTDPTGGNAADFIQENNANAQHFITQSMTTHTRTAARYTGAVWIKPAGRSWARVTVENSTTSEGIRVSFNVSAGTTGTTVTMRSAELISSSITSAGNGWYLCTVTAKLRDAGVMALSVEPASADNTTTYAGDNTSGLYLFGASFRGAQWASTYVKTEAEADWGPWFQDSAGRGLLFSGPHHWSIFHGQDVDPADYNITDWVRQTVSTNWTFQRGWTFDSRVGFPGTLAMTPFPWPQTGPGNEAGGGLKFDLSQRNPTFINQVSNRVSLLNDHGIYVSYLFFQGWPIDSQTSSWPTNLHNSANNINGVLSSASDAYTSNNATWYGYMTNYVKDMIDALNGFPNLLWEVGNEMPMQSTNFCLSIAQFIKDYEATKPYQHPIAITSFSYQSFDPGGLNLNTNLLNVAPSDWTSHLGVPNNEGYRTNPPAWYGPQVHMLDTDHIWGYYGTRTFVWRAFTRGYNPLQMDTAGSGYTYPAGYAADVTTRKHYGHIVRYANKVKLRTMVPAPAMSSKGFILTNASLEYLAYNPDNSSFTTKLPAGYYYYEIFNTSTADGGIQDRAFTRQPSSGDFTWHSPGNEFLVFAKAVANPGGGVEFDATDDYMSNNLSWSPTSFTVAWWLFPRTLTANYNHVMTAADNWGSFQWHCDPNGSMWVGTDVATRMGTSDIAAGTLAPYQWQHLAYTYNGTQGRMYRNGVLVGGPKTQTAPAAWTKFIIGYSNAATIDGWVQDVRVYSTALSATEILAIVNARSFKGGPMRNLRYHWPLNNGPDGTSADGDAIVDRSGTGSNLIGIDGANNTGLTWRAGGWLRGE